MQGFSPLASARVALAAGAALLAGSAVAQVNFSAGTYNQAFNTLYSTASATWTDNSTLPGWYASSKSTAGVGLTTILGGTGSGTAGGLYSFGSSGSSERALGTLPSSGTGNIAFGVRFVNDTGVTVNNIAIGFTAEEWRVANATAQTLNFSYQIGSNLTDPDPTNGTTWVAVPALNFTSPVNSGTGAALDGNNSANRQVFSPVSLTGVQVLPGQEIFFRWYATKATSGSSDGLGIDDLSITFSGVSVTNPPTISDAGQPQSRVNNASTAASFAVSPDGTAPFSYKWFKGNNSLSDGGKITGSSTALLTISNVLAADADNYSVIVSNSAGAVTSAVATLTVKDPAILSQTFARTYYSGDTAQLSVTAAGTPPLTFAWNKDLAPLSNGGNISGADTSNLTVSSLTYADQGSYQVTVANGISSASSTASLLTVRVVPSAKVALWSFNDTNAPLASPAPAVGNGTASLLDNVTASYAAGTSTDQDPVNEGWNISGYPVSTNDNKTAGVQFNVNTVGYTNILVSWEERHSNTASKYARLQYSTDGTNFTDLDVITGTGSFAYYSHDFTGVTAVENNPHFAFRIVTEFESTAIGSANANYVPVSGTYGTNGTVRFDLVGVFGESTGAVTPIPLQIQQVGSNAMLTWTNAAFVLQSAPSPLGPFTSVSGATSPYTVPLTGAKQFFRLKH